MGFFCRKKSDVERISVGGVPLPISFEGRHLAMSGATGSGKTVSIRSIVRTIRRRGDSALIIDAGGELMSEFYKHGDVILSPLDARSMRWDVVDELETTADSARLAAALIPAGSGGSGGDGDEWIGYSRALVAGVLPLAADIRQLHDLLILADSYPPQPDKNGTVPHHTPSLSELLAGTPAGMLFEAGASRMLASVRGLVGTKLGWLPHASAVEGEGWSARGWAKNIDSRPAVVWLPVRADHRHMMSPLVTAIVSQAITQILSLSSSPTRRVWLLMDELGRYPAISDLPSALTEGRKFGLRVIVGYQSVSQLINSYGHHKSVEILSCIGTHLVLRSADPDSSEWGSRLLGSREVIRKTKSRGDHGTTSNEQIREERLVPPSELASLPDLAGYMRSPGDYQIVKVTIPLPARSEKKTDAYQAAPWVQMMRQPEQMPSPAAVRAAPAGPLFEINEEELGR